MGLSSSSSCISSAQEYIEPLYNKSIGAGTPHKASKVADHRSTAVPPLLPCPSSLEPLVAINEEGAVTETMEKQPQQRPRTFTMDSSDETTMDDDEEDNDHDDMLGLSDIERTHEERDDFVAFSYANGVEQRYVLNDNPHSFVGWEVHVESQGIGYIAAVRPPTWAGISFDIQMQDGRCMPIQIQFEKVTFLDRIF